MYNKLLFLLATSTATVSAISAEEMGFGERLGKGFDTKMTNAGKSLSQQKTAMGESIYGAVTGATKRASDAKTAAGKHARAFGDGIYGTAVPYLKGGANIASSIAKGTANVGANIASSILDASATAAAESYYLQNRESTTLVALKPTHMLNDLKQRRDTARDFLEFAKEQEGGADRLDVVLANMEIESAIAMIDEIDSRPKEEKAALENSDAFKRFNYDLWSHKRTLSSAADATSSFASRQAKNAQSSASRNLAYMADGASSTWKSVSDNTSSTLKSVSDNTSSTLRSVADNTSSALRSVSEQAEALKEDTRIGFGKRIQSFGQALVNGGSWVAAEKVPASEKPADKYDAVDAITSGNYI